MPPHLSRSSLRMLDLSLVTQRLCPLGPMCICLNHQERAAVRRVGKIVRHWKRSVKREERKARLVAVKQRHKSRRASKG